MPVPGDSQAGSGPMCVTETGRQPSTATGVGRDFLIAALLCAGVVAMRLPYLHNFSLMGKDGPLYIHALTLDRNFNVPMPGNIGYVLLGKFANLILANPIHAYLAVNIALTCVGVVFTYLFTTLVIPRPLAAATAFALACNPLVWWHGAVIASYPVWLAVMPSIGYFGLRFVRGRAFSDLLGATIALGVGMILRPDLLAFGSPLWFGCLALGRARWRDWLIAIAILATACACWFFGTAWVLGGVDIYLERVRAKSEGDSEGFSFQSRGLVEGLLRNGTKYGLFLGWSAALFLIPFSIAAVRRLGTLSTRWRGTLLALLWVGPSWYFSFFVFAGNAGLIFPFLPLLYLGAAQGVDLCLGRGSARKPVVAMGVLGLLSALQFVATPLLHETNQRQVILNVMFFRHTGAGIRERYNYNLDDYGISPSLASVSRQIRSAEPIPYFPPKN
ncbi:hypothetical protein V5E97_01805 [Singulisphaera sp. Ch08]|uniref:Glycosyltransferase RgtA/B/C/D-like domain-containing protein n=1 Tax=Singulisphaera sp. Ch08 TaxID=3120278 RepID=A0AAU7CH21_9BACT